MNWVLIFSNAIYTAISINAIAYALIAQGLNVHFGYTGLLNFGQAAFAAAGAYAIAIPVSRYGWSFWATIPVLLTAADRARPAPRHPDAAPPRRLPRHRHHRRRRRSCASRSTPCASRG